MEFNRKFKRTDYNYDIIGEEVNRIFLNFLKFFDCNKIFFFKYEEPINLLNLNKIIIQFLTSTVFINFEHIIQFSDELSDVIQEQYVRLEPYLRITFNEFFINYSPKSSHNKELWISFYNIPNKKKFKLVNFRLLNRLSSITGIITRISDYFPKLFLGTFQCSNVNCNFKIWHVEENYIYIEPKNCLNCGNVNWILNTKESAFIFLRKLRIQEINKNIWPEQAPCSINLYMKYNQTDYLKIGKKFIFSGFLIVLPIKDLFFHRYSYDLRLQEPWFQDYSFLKKIKENISCNFYFWVSHYYPYKQYSYTNIFGKDKHPKFTFNMGKYSFSIEEKKKILKIKNNRFLLTDFLNNFHSNISISQELKIGILMMFIGRKMQEATYNFITQNNINICAFENISFRKFDFIKNIISFFPGAFYLNANIYSQTKFMASVLNYLKINQTYSTDVPLLFSDKSICIVDNFNILSSEGQDSILEIFGPRNTLSSVSKIQINLKNNTSLLVFVKPEEKKKTILKEINTILLLNNYNNFDLFFTLTNNHSESVGYLEHINSQFGTYKKFKRIIDKEKSYLKKFHFYQYYIRCLKPQFSKKSYIFLLKLYNFMRKKLIIADIYFSKITIRHFETLIKLSEAISKFYLSLYIEEFHIKASLRLLIFSIYSYTYSDYILCQQNMSPNSNQKKINFLSDLNQKNKLKKNRNSDMFEITSKEFEFLYKNLVFELKKFAKIGIIGLPLRKLLYNLIGNFNYKLNRNKMSIKLILILLIIKKLVIKRSVLILIKHYLKGLNHSYVNIICLDN